MTERLVLDRCACTCGKLFCSSRRDRPVERRPHGNAARYKAGCRCEECTAAETTRTNMLKEARQSRTLDSTKKGGQMWTGPELEIATREDLTIEQAAVKLGRTYRAVQNMRRKCRQDPRKMYLLGVTTPA
jgi:hypothetical protein